MGDRSNIVIDQGDGTRVWLYGHWMGAEAISHAKFGLESGRVNDSAYLARIILCDMTKEDPGGETGFGISTSIGDNTHPIIVIAPDSQLVWLEDEGGKELTPHCTPARFIADASLSGEDFEQLISLLNLSSRTG